MLLSKDFLKSILFFAMLSSLIFLTPTLTLLAHEIKPSSRTIYVYKGDILFMKRNGSVFISDGFYILSASVVVNISNIKRGLINLSVSINGPLYYDPALANCSGSSFNVLLETCDSSPLARLVNESYRLTLTYSVNVSNNYAWLGNRFVGFFPLYVVPDIGYDNATRFKYVYLGEELTLLTVHGKPAPVRVKKPYGSSSIELHCIVYNNTYVDLCLLHHYPLYVWGFLPIGDNRFALVYLEVDDSMVGVLASVNDYPASVEYVDYVRVGLLVSVVALIIVGVYGVVRRFRRGKG
jgi:hypothetical protein